MLEINEAYSTAAYNAFLEWFKESVDGQRKFTNVYLLIRDSQPSSS